MSDTPSFRMGIPDNFQGVPGFAPAGMSGVANQVTPIPANQDMYKGQYYQWMGGPNLGLVERVERSIMIGGKVSIMLSGGQQLPQDEFLRMLKKVDAPSQVAPVNAPPAAPALTPEARQLIESLRAEGNAPNPLPVSQPIAETINNQPIAVNKQSVKTEQGSITVEDLSDPVVNILSKKKENLCKVECVLRLDLPKQALFDMLVDDFDKTPEDVLKLIINEKNISLIKEELVTILLDYYGKEKTEIIEEINSEIIGEENANANPL